MPTTYTSLLGMALPATGELNGTWGDTVNNYITGYVDASVAGTQTISGSQTAVTLSVTNGTSLSQVGSGSTGSAQYATINCTGNPASLLTITAPASSKTYTIINATSTSQSVKIVGAGPTTGVTIVSGEKATVVWNGSDFVKIASTVITNLTGTLGVANGGTGLTSGTSGGVLAFTASGTIASSGALAANAIVIGGGAGVAPSTTTTGTGVLTAVGNAVNATGGLVTVDGSATLTNKTLTNPTVTNYTETLYTANTSTAITVSLANGTVQQLTLTGNATITMPTATAGKSFVIMLKQDGTGGRTVTWSTVVWPGGTAPTITSTASKQDIFSFFSDGTNWYGATIGQSY